MMAYLLWFSTTPPTSQPGNEPHRLGPTPGYGAGWFPASTATTTRKRGQSKTTEHLWHLPPDPLRGFKTSNLRHLISLKKIASTLPRHPFQSVFPQSPISTVRVPLGVGPSTEAWVTYQRPHTHRENQFYLSLQPPEANSLSARGGALGAPPSPWLEC